MGFELDPAPMELTRNTGKFVLTRPLAFGGTEGYAKFNLNDDVVVGDQAIPRKILFESGGGPQPWLRMGIEVRNGVPECTYLELDAGDDSSEVRSKHLKVIHIEEWITQIVAACARHEVPISKTGRQLVHGPATPEQVKIVEGMQRRRRDPHDRELLERVAAIYRAHPEAPAQAISRALGMSQRTASRWAARCSDAGLLPQVDAKGKKRI